MWYWAYDYEYSDLHIKLTSFVLAPQFGLLVAGFAKAALMRPSGCSLCTLSQPDSELFGVVYLQLVLQYVNLT